MFSGTTTGTISGKMFYGKFLIVLVFTITVLGCTNEKTSTSKEKFGHWKYKGSSTFEQRFQCVEKFMPRQNIQCE